MRRGWAFWVSFLLSLAAVVLFGGIRCLAAPPEGNGEAAAGETSLEEGLGELDLSAIEDYLREVPEENGLSFQDLVRDLVSGDFRAVLAQIGTGIKSALTSGVGESASLLGQVVLLGLVGAVFTGFSGICSGGQVSETGFFVTYLLLFTCLAAGFFQSMTIAEAVLSRLVEFMKVLLPSFFLAVAFAGGSVSGAALYGTTLGAIGIFEGICLAVGLPLIQIYALLVLAGKITKEDSLSRLTSLVGQAVSWGLKTMAGLILGFQLIQGMVLPSVDAMGQGGLLRLMEAVPGVGQSARTVTQAVLGSGVVIKNSIGAAGAAVLVVLAAVPLVQLVFLAVLYHGAAALLEPVCDKRVTACIQGISDAHKLLVSLVWTALVLFAVTIAIVCVSTNAMYFAG